MNENRELKCRICGKYYKHLGSHITKKHKILTREYKSKFGLNYNTPLVTESISLKHKLDAKISQTWKKNFKNSHLYQFKIGERKIGCHIRKYISKMKWKEILENLKKMKPKWEQCPVCKIKFKAMKSHLFMKHGLIFVDIRRRKHESSSKLYTK